MKNLFLGALVAGVAMTANIPLTKRTITKASLAKQAAFYKNKDFSIEDNGLG